MVLTLSNKASSPYKSLEANWAKADITPYNKWAFLILTAFFNIPLTCLDNYKNDDSPAHTSSKITKA